ncbi:hypothetical protein ABW99_14690 [Pandoraea thiooxydans]|uniref:ABC-type transport auxiliary lipoprotein component domain-containing protein n=1 Tax=Pandoraea thiooxydans TaxID=445709 RepID=A0A0G3EQM0_9BURK|nr:ABC-type transport auxiliary lipoprotein family protein [Pandoraea thiooxydans]AKJ69275.1 hypothetical protein ABW99_14690 [Pandoraea thiooxydans]
MKRLCLLFACAAALLLSACASGPLPANIERFDLGPPPVAAPGSPANSGRTLAPIKVMVAAPTWLDQESMYYRLPGADGDQARAYADSRWLAPPQRLFGERLRARLASQRSVLNAGDPVAAPLLKIELDEFTQVFDSRSRSHGAVVLRASVFDHDRLVAQTTLHVTRPAPSNDARGGVAALRAATDAAQAALVRWLATVPLS